MTQHGLFVSMTVLFATVPLTRATETSIALNDRSFKPTDDNSERLAIFAAGIRPDGKLGNGPKLSLGEWHTLVFAWDLKAQSCTVSVAGAKALTLSPINATGNGVSYLHLRSKATAVDAAGFYVESVSVDVADPVAPALTKQQKQILLDSYLPSYYTPPPERKGAKQTVPRLFQDDRPKDGVAPVGQKASRKACWACWTTSF